MVNLQETYQFRITIPEPFNFRLTVAKPADWHWSTPGEVFENGTLWSGIYVKGRAIGLRMRTLSPEVEVMLYSDSNLSDSEIGRAKAIVRAGLGEDEDLNEFYAFARSDPVLSVAVKDLYGMRVGRLDDVFGRVILAILLQMAPVARSGQMMSAVLESFGTRMSFDGKDILLWPRPEDIALLDEEELRIKAKLGYRAKRLIQAARFLADRPLSLLELAHLPDERALKKLMEIPGVGLYSAGIVLGGASVPLDVWSVVILSELLLKRTPPKPRQEIDTLTAILKERWGRWGWMAFVYTLNDLDNLANTFGLSRLK